MATKPPTITLARLALPFLLAAALGTSPALADELVYDFRGPFGTAASYAFSTTSSTGPLSSPVLQAASQAETSGTEPGWLFFEDFSDVESSVSQSPAGLGVKTQGTRSRDTFFGTVSSSFDEMFATGRYQVDGLGPNETLNLSLTDAGDFKDHKITELQIALGLSSDDLELLLNGTPVDSFDLSGVVDIVDLTDLPDGGLAISPGDTIGFAASGFNDDFSVLGLTMQATPVPEPMALAVWALVTLAAAVWWRRRGVGAP